MLSTKCSFVFLVRPCLKQLLGFPGDASSKEPGYKENIRDPGSIPGSGRSPGGGHGNPLQYSCPKKPMDSGAWQASLWILENVEVLQHLQAWFLSYYVLWDLILLRKDSLIFQVFHADKRWKVTICVASGILTLSCSSSQTQIGSHFQFCAMMEG